MKTGRLRRKEVLRLPSAIWGLGVTLAIVVSGAWEGRSMPAGMKKEDSV